MKTFRIAIVGAGPAGYFAAQALQNLETDTLKFSIDMFERLPTPWGLVRSGVAPDHPKIKSVSKVFEKIASAENFRLFSNVELGKDIELKELQDFYDAVVIAVGSSIGRKLGIPGEELVGSISSAQFVPWYNGHPDFSSLEFPLDCSTAVVIGAGNVAMDVARTLGLDPEEFDKTDMANYAIEALKDSQIKNVFICARRGPEHAAFTSPELRELPNFQTTSIDIKDEDILSAQSRVSKAEVQDKDVTAILNSMLAISQSENPEQNRKISFRFLLSPLEIKGTDRVEEVVFSVNEVRDGKVAPTGETISIPCGLVVTAIGYETQFLSGLEIENGKVKNVDGKVSKNTYVVGWAKRGPSGVIGTNKSDSAEVVNRIVKELESPKGEPDFAEILKDRKIPFITQSDWIRINEAEILAGELVGKPRVKFTKRSDFNQFRFDS